MLRCQLGYVVEKAVQTQNLAFHAAYADKIERIFSQIRRHFAALEQSSYVSATRAWKSRTASRRRGVSSMMTMAFSGR